MNQTMSVPETNFETFTKPSYKKNVIDKAFFGKDNCLKVQFNKDKNECYFHLGKTANSKDWTWTKIKFNELELGDMINVLDGKKESLAFYHAYEQNKQQIWLNNKGNFFSIKTKDVTKSLNSGEQIVLKVMLENIIWRLIENDE